MLGIFDSGVGGLTVVKEIKRKKPNLLLIYFGDTARVPWGNKSKDTIQAYSKQIVNFLKNRGCDTIVIACNTASVYAGNYLRKEFPEIKFIDVVSPVIDKIVAIVKNEPKTKTAVIGTKATIGSGVYEREIHKLAKKAHIISQACPLFVPLAEEGIKTSELIHELIHEYLRDMVGKIDYLVLGCTHYPLLEKDLSKYFGGKARIVNSAREVAIEIDKIELERGRREEYFLTDLSEHYKKLTERIIGKKIKIKKAIL